MGRTSSIKSHPARDDIETGIALGLPHAVLARKYGIKESAVRYHKSVTMRDVLADMLKPEEPSVIETLGRYRELADSTRAARVAADRVGTPASRARAHSTELSVLRDLSTRLGVTNLETLDFATRAQQYSNAVVRFLRQNPEHIEAITRHLLDQSQSDWGEYVSGLTASIKKATS